MSKIDDGGGMHGPRERDIIDKTTVVLYTLQPYMLNPSTSVLGCLCGG